MKPTIDSDTVHPTPDELSRFVLGKLPEQRRSVVERHVSDCETCCAALGGVADDPMIQLVRESAGLWHAGDTAGAARHDTQVPLTANPPAELSDHPRYAIQGVLGRGGMGTVYRAEHRLMRRSVAVKVINPDLVADPEAARRFLLEIQAAARLDHPNIVTAYDAEQAGRHHFLVMELVDGVSVFDYVARRGPLAVDIAVELLFQAARGLEHAHAQGMVHRDIKPHNLMIASREPLAGERVADGMLKILDFGLARLVSQWIADNEVQRHAASRSGTRADAVVGTAEYMAPEQLQDASRADVRADIHGLGGALFFMLTGRSPRQHAVPLISQITGRPPAVDANPADRLRSLRPDVPEQVIAVARRMLADDPDQRYATPAELLAALAPLTAEALAPVPGSAVGASEPGVGSTSISPGPKHASPRRRRIAATSVVVAAVIGFMLVVAGWFAWRSFVRHGAAAGRSPDVHVLFVLPPRLWYPDYAPVRASLEEAGAAVHVTSTERVVTTISESSDSRLAIEIDVPLLDAKAQHYDAIVLCGGEMTVFRNDSRESRWLMNVLRDQLRSGQFVAAICGGQDVLIRNGLLDNLPAARPPPPYRAAAGSIQWLDQDVVRAGRIITAGDADFAPEFARQLIHALKLR